MFEALISVGNLFFISLPSFFFLFTIRHLFIPVQSQNGYIKKILFIALYHVAIFTALFIFAIGNSGIQNEAYNELKEFTVLEKSNKLDLIKKNPENYGIYASRFKNSREFKAYLKKYDMLGEKAEAVAIGWLFVFLCEISMIFLYLIDCIRKIFIKKNL